MAFTSLGSGPVSGPWKTSRRRGRRWPPQSENSAERLLRVLCSPCGSPWSPSVTQVGGQARKQEKPRFHAVCALTLCFNSVRGCATGKRRECGPAGVHVLTSARNPGKTGPVSTLRNRTRWAPRNPRCARRSGLASRPSAAKSPRTAPRHPMERGRGRPDVTVGHVGRVAGRPLQPRSLWPDGRVRRWRGGDVQCRR